MSDNVKDRIARRRRRRYSIRKNLIGTNERPRLAVVRSLRYVYGQLIDDTTGTTLVSISEKSEVVKEYLDSEKTGKIGRSHAAGKAIAKLAKEKGIESIAFDRGGYLYHGRVKAFADGAREGGLKF